jgi:hypothetical protein
MALGIATAMCKARFPRIGGIILWMGHDAFPCAANTSHAPSAVSGHVRPRKGQSPVMASIQRAANRAQSFRHHANGSCSCASITVVKRRSQPGNRISRAPRSA